jgi:hypothetical protein
VGYIQLYFLIRQSIFEWCVVRCKSDDIYYRDWLTRDWIMCPKFVNHPKFNVQHNRGSMGTMWPSLWLFLRFYKQFEAVLKLFGEDHGNFMYICGCNKVCGCYSVCLWCFNFCQLVLHNETCVALANIWWSLNKNQTSPGLVMVIGSACLLISIDPPNFVWSS